MSKERNQFLEVDGLYWESETHEWFHDKIGTNYAQTDNGLNKDALKNIYCFVTRDKETVNMIGWLWIQRLMKSYTIQNQ